ncbi:hypothetical protein ACFL1X_14670 [Candidatus Hydrogenedentota bacterium]
MKKCSSEKMAVLFESERGAGRAAVIICVIAVALVALAALPIIASIGKEDEPQENNKTETVTQIERDEGALLIGKWRHSHIRARASGDMVVEGLWIVEPGGELRITNTIKKAGETLNSDQQSALWSWDDFASQFSYSYTSGPNGGNSSRRWTYRITFSDDDHFSLIGGGPDGNDTRKFERVLY